MNDEFSINEAEVPDQPDNDLASLLASMQQQLLRLEKKMDQLLRRSQEKTFERRSPQGNAFGKRPFSKSYPSYDHSHNRAGKQREHNTGNTDAPRGHFYENRPQEKSRHSNPRKKTNR